MGTNNIHPDADNVIRKYPNYELLTATGTLNTLIKRVIWAGFQPTGAA